MCLFVGLAGVANAQTGSPVFDSVPTPVPPNVPSLGYQATSTAEWGDHIALDGSHRRAGSATVLMSNWALHSTYPWMDAAGYVHPITLNIYAVDNSGTTPAAGPLLGTLTQNFLIPWRPEASPDCTGNRWKSPTDGECYSGFAFEIGFDLRSLALDLPDELIFGVAYNTNTWGYSPIGLPGPYESLNVGTSNVGNVGVAPSIGTDVDPDVTFWNTSHAGFYSDGGAGGVGTFRADTGWTGYQPAVQFTAFSVALTKDACKANGWKSLSRANGTSFKNQGACVSYVNTGK